MKKIFAIIFISLGFSQNPVSDQGLDQIVSPGESVTISGENSYALDGNTINTYQWSVHQDILDANPGINLTSETLVFTAPNSSSSTIYTITLEVVDDQGNSSQIYDASNLILTEYCEVGTGNPSANKFLEIYNGTGGTITSDEWVDYEIWISKNGAEFMDSDQDFYAKLFFHRLATEDDADHDLDVDDITSIYPDDLEHGETLILIKELAEADSDITEHYCIEWGDLTRIGGDDGVALVKDGVPIDTVGEGDDPGSGWEVAGESNGTKDNILVRKSTVVLGNYLNWDSSAGTDSDNSEWIIQDDEDFSYVGSHDCTSCDNSIDIIVAIPPVANAGDDFSTCEETVSLSGTSASEDEGEYTYSWTAPGAVPLSDGSVSNPSFTSPTNLSDDTIYCFQLVINDGYVDSASDEVCVTVEANLCPVASAGEDKSYRINTLDEIVLSASASYDPNAGDILSYEWEQIEGSDLALSGSDLEDLTVSGLPATLDVNPSEYTFELTVLDQGNQVSDPDTIKISLADFEVPASPNLYAVPYSDYIKLSWDFVSEGSIDPLTKYADFEGYKLYRSEDGGETWCSSEFIVYDFDGNAVGCQPIAQFDLTEDQDNLHCVYKEGYVSCDALRGEYINEYDPVDGWVFLGEDSGLEHIYIDEDVVEGMEYTYTLTAYDMGLRTYSFDYVFLENSVSTGEPYEDSGSDGCTDNYEDGIGGCVESETPGSDDPNGDNYDESSNSEGTEGNGQYDIGEPYTDTDLDGQWDGDPVYTQETNWSSSNPDQWTSQGQSTVSADPDINYGYPSQESELGSEGDNNFVQAVAAGLPSNISEPTAEGSENFIIADLNNIGNGDRYFDVVDRSDIKDTFLKFEVQAEYGVNENGNIINSFEGNKCENPSLYVWEVDALGNPLDFYEVLLENLSSSTSLAEELDIPGVYQNEDNNLVYPTFLVEDMSITFSDELGAGENWTDLIYGTRFKFDNSYFFFESTKDGALYIPPIRDAYTIEASEDSTLMTSLFISNERSTQISYYSQQIFDMRPPYKYMIEFSDSPEYSVADMVVPAQPYGGAACSDEQGLTKVPFRVQNLTTGEWVNLMHRDYGLNDGYVTDEEGNSAPDYGADGRKDCFWTRSELILFNEVITTYYTPSPHAMSTNYPNEDNYTYELDLDYFMFREFNTDDWDEGIQYSEGDKVLHQSMIWKASNVIPNFIPPPTGSDENGKKGWFDCGADLKCNQDEEGYDVSTNPDPEGDDYDEVTNPEGDENDGFNDNPWAPSYPWEDEDKFYFTPIAWYADGDNWMVDLGEIGEEEQLNQSHLADITVVPNPYRARSNYNRQYDEETVRFKNLPSTCVIEIYTITGKLVDTINFDSSENGGSDYYPWHLKNKNGEKVAPGLYIYYVQSNGLSQTGKFSIVR